MRPRPGASAGPRRLIVAIVAVIVVVLVGWFWIRACQADAQRRAYENYVTDVNSVVKQSDDIGARLDNALLDPTATKSKLVEHGLEPREAAGRGIDERRASCTTPGACAGCSRGSRRP